MRLLLVALSVLPLITEAKTECNLDYYTGCYAWPSVDYVDCRDGFVPGAVDTELWGEYSCGFAGQKGYCVWDGDTPYDYGCGCNEGTDCLKQDCVLGQWSDWSACSIGCDPDAPVKTGLQHRTRSIVTEPVYGGLGCEEISDEYGGVLGMDRECTSHECARDCEVGAWTPWNTCNKKCGPSGRQFRFRTVTQPQVGSYSAPCPLLSDMRACNTEKDCFWYTLTGRSGKEKVKVTDGNNTEEYSLTIPVTLSTSSSKVFIDFTNDKSDRDVWFDFRRNPDESLGWLTTGTIRHTNKSEWKCGTSKENKRCGQVNDQGLLKWGGVYEVKFDSSVTG